MMWTNLRIICREIRSTYLWNYQTSSCDQIIVGSRCDDILKTGDITRVSSEERDVFYRDVLSFYMTLVIKQSLFFPIGSGDQSVFLHRSFLESDSCHMLRFEDNAVNAAKKMPAVISVNEHSNLMAKAQRVDKGNVVKFWLKIETPSSYPNLSKLTLAALCLHHGNPDSERVLKLLLHNLSKE